MFVSRCFERFADTALAACVEPRIRPIKFGLPSPLVTVGKGEIEFDSIAASAVVDRCEWPFRTVKTLSELIAEFLKALVFRVLIALQVGPVEHR